MDMGVWTSIAGSSSSATLSPRKRNCSATCSKHFASFSPFSPASSTKIKSISAGAPRFANEQIKASAILATWERTNERMEILVR